MPTDPLRMPPKRSLGIFKGLGEVLDKRAGREKAAVMEQQRLEDRLAQQEMRELQKRSLEQALQEKPAPPVAWREQETEDGSIVQVNPITGQVRPLNIKGPRKAETPRNIDPLSPAGIAAAVERERRMPVKQPTEPKPAAPAEFEKKAAFMIEGAKSAATTLDTYQPTPRTFVNKVPGLGNYGLSETDQVALNAAETLHDAYLRLTTGATVTPDELRRAAMQYVPQPGDGPQVLKAKKERRAQILRALESAASSVRRPEPATPAKTATADPEFDALMASLKPPRKP